MILGRVSASIADTLKIRLVQSALSFSLMLIKLRQCVKVSMKDGPLRLKWQILILLLEL